MQSVSLLGHYEPDNQEVHLKVNNSTRSSDPLVHKYCEKMISEKLEALTIEFDDETFIYFTEESNKIRFIEGPVRDYARLIAKVKSGLDGEYVKPEKSELQPEPEKTVITADTPVDDSTRIHESLGQPIQHFQKAYTNAEIFFNPFEAPGGDFYWTRDYQYKNFVVVGDCTGHGMQGALIGMSVMTLLKHFFKLPPTNLAESITEFHTQMYDLMENEALNVFDAELGFIYLDKRNNSLSFAGSGINMIYKNAESCTNYRSSKRSLVKGQVELANIEAQKGDQIFIYSDGITDQFDNANQRKLGTKGLMQLVRELPTSATIEDFNRQFDYFKGATEPLDDQTMMILTV